MSNYATNFQFKFIKFIKNKYDFKTRPLPYQLEVLIRCIQAGRCFQVLTNAVGMSE